MIGKLSLIGLLVLLPCILLAQNLVLARKIGNEVYLAADSKVAQPLVGSRKEASQATNPHCRIRTSGQFIFAVAGYIGEPSVAIVTMACQKAHSLQEAATLIEQGIQAGLEADLSILRKQNKPAYQKLSTGADFGGIMLCGLDKGQVEATSINWFTRKRNNEPVKVGFRMDANSLLCIGYHKTIEYSISNPFSDIWRKPSPGGMEQLILQEAKASAQQVEGPVDIIKMDNTGRITWVKRKQPCS